MSDADTVLRMYDTVLKLMEDLPSSLKPGLFNDENANQFKYFTTMGQILKVVGLFRSRIDANTTEDFEYPMSNDNRFNHDRVEFFYNHFVNPPIRHTENIEITPMNLPNSQETFNIIGEIMNNYVACLRSPVHVIDVGETYTIWREVIQPHWDNMYDDPQFATQISGHFKNFRNLVLKDFNYTIDKLFTMLNTT